MKNGTEKYIETVKYLERLYDFCNEKLFDNGLEKPVITVQLDGKNKAYGWFTCGKVWKESDKDNEAHEINITAQYLNRPVKQIASTMIHEMCHYYAELNNMQDTSRSGTYHNKLFKQIAEKHGLVVSKMPTIGWSHTELNLETDALITDFIKDNPETLIYRTPVFAGQMVKTSSTRKYVCPCCQQSVRATKQVNIMCLDCNEPMTVEEQFWGDFMKFYYKVVFELADGGKTWSVYESTSISALISYLSDCGCAVGYIDEVKRIKRLPKCMLPYKGCYE